MKNWFFQLSRKRQIVVCVVAAHVVCLLFLTIDFLVHHHSNKRQKVIVHTVHITPPKKQIAQAPKQALQNKVMKPVASKKSVTKSPKAPPAVKMEKKSKEPDNAKLLEEIEANFEAIAAISAPKKAQTTIQIPSLTTSSSHILDALSSEEIIATFLREVLTLPELGEVKAVLTINREGRLVSLDILLAKSEKNAAFLRNRLPQLQFPCLNEEATITALFSNAL